MGHIFPFVYCSERRDLMNHAIAEEITIDCNRICERLIFLCLRGYMLCT